MDAGEFEQELRARGGSPYVWLVFVEHSYELLLRGSTLLNLRRAFWTRGAAYSYAYGAHEQRRWQHHHVFVVTADAAWAQTTETRVAAFEMTFGRTRELPMVLVTAAEVAAVMEAAP